MGKVPRIDVANYVYHAYNRGNAGRILFSSKKDYLAFENILEEGKEKVGIRILGYCLMPNHWHFVLHPEEDGQLKEFFHWLTLTHTQRWQVVYGMVGQGHLYQGRYKSNLCEDDSHFYNLITYVERNALRAGLVQRAEEWQWSSVWRREKGNEQKRKLLSQWPFPIPAGYINELNARHDEDVTENIRTCVRRGRPYGSDLWVGSMVDQFKLESSMRTRGGQTKQK